MDRSQLDTDSALVWRDHDPPGSFLSAAHLAMFDADGYCVVADAIALDILRSVEREIDCLERDRNDWLREQPEGRSWISKVDVIDFAPTLVAKSAALRDFSREHPLRAICRDLVGPDVRLYFDQAVYKRPSTPTATLPLHQDNGYNFKRPEAYITVWLPLQDVEPDNGCLLVAPGIHRLGTLKHRVTEDGYFVCGVDPNDAIAVPARAGDAVVLSSLTPHATSGNRSSRIRKAYLLSYVPDGTRLRDGSLCCEPNSQYQVLRNGAVSDA